MVERAVVDEVALELSCTRWLADRLVTTSLTLTGEFPATLDALRAGELDPRKAETIAAGLAELNDPVLRGHAEKLVLALAPELNVPTLRERIKQAVLRVRRLGSNGAWCSGPFPTTWSRCGRSCRRMTGREFERASIGPPIVHVILMTGEPLTSVASTRSSMR